MKKIIFVLAVSLMLTGCDNAKDRAAKHLAAAKDYVSQGDIPRAIVELRNALKNNDQLREAQLLFASLMIEQNRPLDAFGQYRRMFEADPKDLDAMRGMAQIAFDQMSWDDAEHFSNLVLEASADDREMLAVRAGVAYRDAARAQDPDEMERAASAAAKLLAEDPALLRARRVVVAENVRAGKLQTALDLVDEGLVAHPDDRDLNNVRLVIYGRMGNISEVETQILSMIALYPDDPQIGKLLVEFYLSQGRIDQAEQWLRDRIDPNGSDPQPRLVVLRFISELRSQQDMRDDLVKMLAEDPQPEDIAQNLNQFLSLKAGADFTLGDQAGGMRQIEDLIAKLEPGIEQDRLKIQLAQMRITAGNVVGARSLVEEVLARDAGQPGALKLKASWLIDADDTEGAIRLLRQALSATPDDAQILSLLARAYERDGKPQLMADMMARAVQASNQAAPESLRYANWLALQGQSSAAETVLVDALRRDPNNISLLGLLARVHLTMEDWGRMRQDIASIRDRFEGDEQAQALANELQAQMLQGQGRVNDLTDFLERLGAQLDDDLGARIAVIRNSVRTGHMSQALTEAQALVAQNPQSPDARVLLSRLQLASGEPEKGIQGLEALVADMPQTVDAWQILSDIALRREGPEAGLSVLDKGLASNPDDRLLLASKAVILEREGDTEAAITIYEILYTANSNDLVIANNLASLLASTRKDEESLDRAWVVARRLNGAQEPAFQDTYGWIAFRRGETSTALRMLKPAAKGLPNDPAVAYHLASAYAAENQTDAADQEVQRARALLEGGAISYPSLSDDLDALSQAIAR